MTKEPLTILTRVNIDPRTMCWEWNRWRNNAGYGAMTIEKRTFRAHRLSYEIFVGPIPEGLTLDHLCRNRACCNPAHLEPVTHRENVLRGDTITARCATKTHCPKGHALTLENVRPDRLKKGQRECLTCHKGRRTFRFVSNASKTHCNHGHDLSGDNVWYEKRNRRKCKACSRERRARLREHR